MKTINLFNFNFANLTYPEVLKAIDKLLKEKSFHYFITMNPEILLNARKDVEIQNIIQKADYIFADGMGIVLGSIIIKQKKLKKITGSDLTPMLLEQGKYSFYLLGSKPEVIQKAVENIKITYPKSKILGFNDGYFKPEVEKEIISEIKKLKPDFILLGLGSPKQDYFLQKLQNELDHGIGIGIGGVFEIFAGEKKRSPKLLQKIGLEWVYRGIIDPKRIKRWVFIPKYFKLILREFFS